MDTSVPAGASKRAGGTTPPEDFIGEAIDELKVAGRELVQTVMTQLAAKALKKIEQAGEQLESFAEEAASGGGPQMSGLVAAAKAKLEGANPLWAGIKGAWSGSSTKTKVLVVAALALLVILAPVPSLLVLLTLLVVWIVRAIKHPT